MDILASFNINELPEQQTRMIHLMKEYPNFDLKLGFDACCTCGKTLSNTIIYCNLCKRVGYCSNECKQIDSTPSSQPISRMNHNIDNNDDEYNEEEEETALGHTPIICSILKACNDDEDVEDDNDDAQLLSNERRQAAMDRIRSENESYPATLANVILQGKCFQQTLKECRLQHKSLAIHVIGASVDAELFSNNNHINVRIKDYAEAFTNLTSTYKDLNEIDLIFIGPDCPEMNIDTTTFIPNNNNDDVGNNKDTLSVRTVKGIYRKEFLDSLHIMQPDIVVFFNPGFTVPEYEYWNETLKSIPRGIPFLLTTNTEMEGIADCQYLLDQDCIKTVPPALAEMFGLCDGNSHNDDDEMEDNNEQVMAVFTENPFCGSRVRQSGTMANDLFVKNRWMLMGIIDSVDISGTKKDSIAKRIKTNDLNDDNNNDNNNNKINNPALI